MTRLAKVLEFTRERGPTIAVEAAVNFILPYVIFALAQPHYGDVQALISMINERLWVGHFDLWITEGIVMFRHALILAGGTEPSNQQCQSLLGTALDTCERYFSAFQFVVWAGKTPKEALEAAMFETSGEA